MKGWHFGTVVAATLVLGVVAAEARPVELSEDQTQTIEKTVASLLRNSSDAVFGKPEAALAPDGSIVVCGRYSTTDGFVGFSGKTAYMGRFDSFDGGKTRLPAFNIVRMPDSQPQTKALLERCSSSGIVLPPIDG